MTIFQEQAALSRAIVSSDFTSARVNARLKGAAHGGAA